jgi:hypothetical protein
MEFSPDHLECQVLNAVSTLHVSNFFSGTGEDKSSEEINQSIGPQKPCAQLHQRIPFYGPSLEQGQIPECK